MPFICQLQRAPGRLLHFESQPQLCTEEEKTHSNSCAPGVGHDLKAESAKIKLFVHYYMGLCRDYIPLFPPKNQ